MGSRSSPASSSARSWRSRSSPVGSSSAPTSARCWPTCASPAASPPTPTSPGPTPAREVTMGELLAERRARRPDLDARRALPAGAGPAQPRLPERHQDRLRADARRRAARSRPAPTTRSWRSRAGSRSRSSTSATASAVPRRGRWPTGRHRWRRPRSDTIPREIWGYIRKVLPHHGLTARPELGPRLDDFVESSTPTSSRRAATLEPLAAARARSPARRPRRVRRALGHHRQHHRARRRAGVRRHRRRHPQLRGRRHRRAQLASSRTPTS